MDVGHGREGRLEGIFQRQSDYLVKDVLVGTLVVFGVVFGLLALL